MHTGRIHTVPTPKHFLPIHQTHQTCECPCNPLRVLASSLFKIPCILSIRDKFESPCILSHQRAFSLFKYPCDLLSIQVSLNPL
jgi:hypothetical protein